ncbi:hypothetical protein AB4Z38_12325 [Arthrobacter sp. 2RAF6]|uniref:hypothetical protein n=1 Tax=Arthrobacter sp. 2RAF6 TaxID=3233002 RepID=UPI003F91E99E
MSSVRRRFAHGVGYALASAGPFLFGLLHHPGDRWLPSFGMLGAWLLVLTLGASMINKPRELEDAFPGETAKHSTEQDTDGVLGSSSSQSRHHLR